MGEILRRMETIFDNISKEVAEAKSQAFRPRPSLRSYGLGLHVDYDGSGTGQIQASSLSRSKTVAGGSVTSGLSLWTLHTKTQEGL